MKTTDYGALPLKITSEGTQKRFELHFDGTRAYIDYILNKQQVIYLTHTEVPVGFEGKGIGSVLVRKVLQYIRDEELKMAPLCPFVAAYLKRHPEQGENLLAPGFRIG